jgi:hypothetical protein
LIQHPCLLPVGFLEPLSQVEILGAQLLDQGILELPVGARHIARRCLSGVINA